MFATAARRDPGIADEQSPARLEKVWREFHDKLNPAERWLRSHVGELWDDVRSQLVRRFDTRSVPGRHVVFCHMLPWVRDWLFVVDERGVLLERPRIRYRWSSASRSQADEARARSFLGSRRVGARGSAFFWFAPTFANGEPTGRYRQGRRLSQAETRAWVEFLPQTRERFAEELRLANAADEMGGSE